MLGRRTQGCGFAESAGSHAVGSRQGFRSFKRHNVLGIAFPIKPMMSRKGYRMSLGELKSLGA